MLVVPLVWGPACGLWFTGRTFRYVSGMFRVCYEYVSGYSFKTATAVSGGQLDFRSLVVQL